MIRKIVGFAMLWVVAVGVVAVGVVSIGYAKMLLAIMAVAAIVLLLGGGLYLIIDK